MLKTADLTYVVMPTEERDTSVELGQAAVI